jgi:hypothetical protein
MGRSLPAGAIGLTQDISNFYRGSHGFHGWEIFEPQRGWIDHMRTILNWMNRRKVGFAGIVAIGQI